MAAKNTDIRFTASSFAHRQTLGLSRKRKVSATSLETDEDRGAAATTVAHKSPRSDLCADPVTAMLDVHGQNALAALKAGKNLLLIGPAGTGKTTIINGFNANIDQHTYVLRTAYTRAAAGETGVTMHFLLAMKPKHPFSASKAQSRLHDLIHTHNPKRVVLVIDEISMAPPDMLGYIDQSFRRFFRNTNPFGGVQVVMVGDFNQIAPVEDKVSGVEKFCALDIPNLHRGKLGISALFKELFGTPKTPNPNGVVVLLEKNYRQKDDPEFTKIVSLIRQPDIGGKGDYLDQALGACKNAPEKAIHLYARNSDVDAENREKLLKLNTERQIYPCRDVLVSSRLKKYVEDSDITDIERKRRHYSVFSATNAPEEIELAEGARVMLTVNSKTDPSLYNGRQGVVVKMKNSSVDVLFDGNEKETEIEYNDYIIYDPASLVASRKPKEDAVRYQLPLRLGWAATFHKVQGATLSDGAHVHLEGAWDFSMVYVGLTRCTTMKNMTVTGFDSALMKNKWMVSKATHFINAWIRRMSTANHQPPKQEDDE